MTGSGKSNSETEPLEAVASEKMRRRKFLAIGGAGVVGLAGAGFVGNRLWGQRVSRTPMPEDFAAAQAAETGPRSLVCIFLEGGADSANMFIPVDFAETGSTHDVYSKTRGAFAVPASNVLPFRDGQFGFNPALPSLAGFANDNRLAVVQNVGPLHKPTTRADFESKAAVPQSLFAHDAQQKLWQTARPTLTSSQGWGGSLSAVVAGEAETAPSFSINGSNIWQSGPNGSYIRLSPTVPIERLSGFDASTKFMDGREESVQAVLQQSLRSASSSGNLFEQEVARLVQRSIATTEKLQDATSPSDSAPLMSDIVGNGLGMQLQQVARLIRNRGELEMPRQVFFVRMTGWDTHGQQAERFPVLLAELDAALTSFQAALDEMGVADSVTTFTASDFGRTLTQNGDGTDHGWGGHAFVFGGAVKAGRYGMFPNYSSTDNPDDTGDRRDNFAGRLIPTTAVCQYGATLARWMGLSDSQLDDTFPELANFEQRDLGFL